MNNTKLVNQVQIPADTIIIPHDCQQERHEFTSSYTLSQHQISLQNILFLANLKDQ